MTVEVRALLIVTAEDDIEADCVLDKIRDVMPTGGRVVAIFEQSRELVDDE